MIDGKVRLSEDDYIRLYPLWRPRDIQEEFQQHSHCESQIRNYYRRLKYGTQGKAYKSLFKTYMNDRPEDIPTHQWKKKIEEEIQVEKDKARDFVWEGIRARQRLRAQ